MRPPLILLLALASGCAAKQDDALVSLPEVAQVELLVAASRPTCKLVHIRDWHFVSRDEMAKDTGKRLTDREWEAFLREVEAVQADQVAILLHLGVRRVLVEGLTPKGVANYRKAAEAVRGAEDEPALREVVLELGAPARLNLEVLPLDDEDTLEQANPIQQGRVDITRATSDARHDSMVRAAIGAGPVAVLILGGGHDLSASVRRLGGGKVAYLRVTPKRYPRLDR